MWRLEPIPAAVRTSPLRTLDRLFVRSLAACVAVGVIVLIGLYFVPAEQSGYTSIDELPERFARLIVEPQTPEAPAQPEVATSQPADGEVVEETAEPEPEPKTQRVSEIARQARRPHDVSDGAKGTARATQVASAIKAGGMLESIDSMLGDMRSLSSSAGPGAGGTSRSAGALERAAADRRQALEAASGSEAGASELAAAEGAAAGHAGGGDLAGAEVSIEDLAPVGGFGSAGGTVPKLRTPESLMAVVHRYAGGIKYCYDVRLREQPGLRGRLVTLITVAPSGAVSRVQVVGNTVKDDDLEDCVLGQVKAWKFPASSGKPISFRCPFVFTPPNE